MKKLVIACTFLLVLPCMASAQLPDTGQTKCYDAAGAEIIPCPSPGEDFYGQDTQYPCNPQSYTQLDASGNDMPFSADYSTTPWAMVRDNVTGLTWEVKDSKDDVQNYANPHDADNRYTWYDSNPATNGGNAGTPGTGTDTEDFINALNSANFGGFSDWRMPAVKELSTVVDSSIPYPGPTIDTGYFPNTVSSYYWSSTTSASGPSLAWYVGFSYGYVSFHYKSGSYYVRAVRSGQ